MIHKRLIAMITLVAVPGCLLGACGEDEGGTSADTDPLPATTVETTAAPSTTVGTDSVEVEAVLERFEYYPACRDTPVRVAGTRYYPVLPEQLDEIDESRYPQGHADTEPGTDTAPDSSSLADSDAVADVAAAPAGHARIAPPGPGDDIGTMTVYTDGMARFESDSGDEVWLTVEPQEYNWVC